MIGDVVLTIFGLAVVLVAGDLLVRGAVGIATRLRVSALVISLTIVAFGTSAPELFVAVNAVLNGVPGIAIGNIVGSNVANVLIVLGLPAIIYPIAARSPGLRSNAFALLVATGLFAATAYGFNVITPLTGAVFIAAIIGYILFLAYRVKSGDAQYALPDPDGFATTSAGRAAIFLVAGLIGLPLGTHLLVDNASAIAQQLGVRESVIGLTIIAFGTSLPELATVFAAALHKRSDVAIGNIIGSNIFNLLAVGGAAGLAGGAAFDAASLRLEIPIMVAATLLLVAYAVFRHDIARLSGVLMTIAYLGFLVLIGSSGGMLQ